MGTYIDARSRLHSRPILGERAQRTLKQHVEIRGIGLHTGQEVTLRFCPAPPDSGVRFRRIDLPNQPEIPADVAHVVETERCTTLGKELVKVYTVEHILAALRAFQLDNLTIELSAQEPPAAGGCAQQFVAMIQEGEVIEQAATIPCYTLDQPIYLSSGRTHLVALPASHFSISYTLDYPKSAAIRSQYCTFLIDSTTFEREIAPCRTFALYEELEALRKQGLIRGGSLENAVVVKDSEIVNSEGLRFPNEMARHKLLDVIGDLSLVGYEIAAHIIAVCSGHASNVAFARKLQQHFKRWVDA